jgi:hypothetical protein
MQTVNSKILHVVISIIKKFINGLEGLLDEIGSWEDTADCFNGLLQNSLAEM